MAFVCPLILFVWDSGKCCIWATLLPGKCWLLGVEGTESDTQKMFSSPHPATPRTSRFAKEPIFDATFDCLYISLGHPFPANTERFHIFFRVFSTFGLMHQNVVTLGGVCACFSKSVRKRHFRNVWVGGRSQFCTQSCKREDTQGTGNAPRMTHYSESDSLLLLPPLSRVLMATCMFHILLQIDVDAGCQKFMLRSLAWVLFTIPKLGCKGSCFARCTPETFGAQKGAFWGCRVGVCDSASCQAGQETP